jgi:serine/threonine protein kinase
VIDSVGDVLDRRYHLRREISRSHFGVVFEAEHLITGRIVAMKRLSPVALESPFHRQMLAREARLLTVLRGPTFVEVLDAGEAPPGAPYLAMELLAGRSLDGLLAARRALPVEVAGLVALGVAEALVAAHARGIVHRDVRPGNVFLPTQRPDVYRPPAKLT